MSLTATSSLESARRKFFMNRRTSCLEGTNETFLGSGGRIESSPKTFHSYFPDMKYVEFMKNFLLADFSELLAVRLISAS